MPLHYEVARRPPHARIVTRGAATPDEFRAIVQALLADPRVGRGMPVLFDAREKAAGSDTAALPQLVDACGELMPSHPVGLLVAPGAAFAAAQQLRQLRPELRLFTAPSAALRWVDGGSDEADADGGTPPEVPRDAAAHRDRPFTVEPPFLPRAVHVSGAAEETYLLALQLEAAGLELAVLPVATAATFAGAMASDVTLVIADLPLPWHGAADDLSVIQRTRPDVPVVFRWGGAGTWSVEEGGAQLGRLIRQALALAPESEQTPEERRRVLQEVVRYQSAHLRLGRLDPWESDDALRQALEIMADTALVERVGVWRLPVDSDRLECEAVFERSIRRHGTGGHLALNAAYRRAIEEATFVAAHDAVRDPRTSAFASDYLVPHGISSMLDAPIRSRGRVAGIVCLEHVGPPRRWNVIEQCAAAAFAGVVGRIFDARERRRIDEEWQESRRLDLVGRMAAAVAHDFSNLATVIVGSSGALLDDAPRDDPRREALVAIHDAGLSAASLVRQLRAYTMAKRTEAQPLELRRELRALQPLVQRLLGTTIQLVVDVGEHDLWVVMDPAQFQAVVLNLAANARDALTRGGTFGLHLDAPLLPSGVLPGDATVRLRAIDDGIGIPPAVLPNIFKPLFSTKGEGGTGLGLSNVRAMVHQAGGTVSVESTAGARTCFSVLLPRTVAPAPPAPVAIAAGLVPPPSVPGTVLIVDDDPAVCGLMKRLAVRLGWTVEAVTSPKAAIDRAQALGTGLGLIVTDLTMRGMSGIELIHAVRGRHPDLPALVVTGHADVEALSDGTLPPAVEVLAKPFDAATFVARLRHMVRPQSPPVVEPPVAAHEDVTVVAVGRTEELRQLLTIVLTTARYRVAVAEDNERACALTEGNRAVSAVVLDGDRPEQLAAIVSRLRRLEWAPGIVLAGEAQEIEAGAAVAVLLKPFAPSELLGAIQAVLRLRTV